MDTHGALQALHPASNLILESEFYRTALHNKGQGAGHRTEGARRCFFFLKTAKMRRLGKR